MPSGKPLTLEPTADGVGMLMASRSLIVTDVDLAVLEELALSSRILARHGVLDGWGHVSMRHPHKPQRYLISRARAPGLVDPADIVELDLDSNPIGTAERLFLERFIHGNAYKARPDVNAVVHSHSPTMIPFGVTGQPLRSISHAASFLVRQAPVWDIRDAGIEQGMLVVNNKQGASLAETLADASVALMRGHGNVVVAHTLRHAVYRAIYAEINAQQLAMALSFDRPIKYLLPDEMHDPKRLDDAWEVWKHDAERMR